jgi:hypothetical protein
MNRSGRFGSSGRRIHTGLIKGESLSNASFQSETMDLMKSLWLPLASLQEPVSPLHVQAMPELNPCPGKEGERDSSSLQGAADRAC